MDTIPPTSLKSLTKYTTFDHYLLTVDAYSKIPQLFGLENINTEEVVNKLDMFRRIFGKVDEFGWWYIERIQTEDGTQFNSRKFLEGLSVRVVRLSLAAPDHQEINIQVEVTWKTLKTIAHSIMVHA